jgi:hypothetical protein
MSQTTPATHLRCIEQISQIIENDQRFDAALVSGSFATKSMDQYSDIDIILVVNDDCYDDVMAKRTEFAAKVGNLISAFTGEHVGEPRLLICLFGPPLVHVDFKFVTASSLDAFVDRPLVLFARDASAIESQIESASIGWPEMSPQWFEDRAWIWLHYGATKIGRGELYEAIGMLGFFRDQILGPMLARRCRQPMRGVRYIENRSMDPQGLLNATVAEHSTPSIRKALLAAAEAYLILRSDAEPARGTPSMPSALHEYIEQC